MKYEIPYEHLQDELVSNQKTFCNFLNVRNNANEYKLELSDDDFKRLFKLSMKDKDVKWLMNQMSLYNQSLTDALVSYISS